MAEAAESKFIPSECPMHAGNAKPKPAPPSGCPMHESNTAPSKDEIDPTNMMPPANQQPSPGQPFELNTERVVSTIPKANADTPDAKWQYPSEQMFWNAMLRKGWRWEKDSLSQEDMSHIIRIHNHNNEEAWKEVLKWEAFRGSNIENIKLAKFGGKASDYSPRARMRAALGYDLPFDRHDWIIDRDGKLVRYVIDYYDIGDEHGYKTGEFVELDVRPALDSPAAFFIRSKAVMYRWAAGVIGWWNQPKEA